MILKPRHFWFGGGVLASAIAWCTPPAAAQSYPSLRSDPSPGNTWDHRNLGWQLRSDPEVGTYSYFAQPCGYAAPWGYEPYGPVGYSAAGSATAAASLLSAAGQADEKLNAINQQLARGKAGVARGGGEELPAGEEDAATPEGAVATAAEIEALEDQREELLQDKSLAQFLAASAINDSASGFSGGPVGRPFDATAGLRNISTPLGVPDALRDDNAVRAVLAAKALGYDAGKLQLADLYHQPLIQVKVRVVEVERNDGFRANSILEYVGNTSGIPSLTSGQPANIGTMGGQQNVRGISRFDTAGLVTNATTGQGLLYNLTTRHINLALQLLATQFSADVVTAPEVVTLNGQNVEFLSGQKVPFQIGQNTVTGNTNNIQQFFYKNIGTLVSVTPKIVNWGYHGEGDGEAPIVSSEITNWNALAGWMLGKHITIENALADKLGAYRNNTLPIPFDTKSEMLIALNKYTRSNIVGGKAGFVVDGQPVFAELTDQACLGEAVGCAPNPFRDESFREWFCADSAWIDNCENCSWQPNDCTIDLSIIVRLSDAGMAEVEIDTAAESSVKVASEANVRAVANVIQVKSGSGVVMAGLIGEREQEAIAKVPFVGDLPWIGAAFRSKETVRQKTEVLIFVEAQVLDPRPDVARYESYEDFRLSRDFVDDELLNNPLEVGMYRVGFGGYLPPLHIDEAQYWTRFHRKLRNFRTHVDDFIE